VLLAFSQSASSEGEQTTLEQDVLFLNAENKHTEVLKITFIKCLLHNGAMQNFREFKIRAPGKRPCTW